MNPAQEAARRLLEREIPENVRNGFNTDYGLTLSSGYTFLDALIAVYRKRAAEGDAGAKEVLKAYGWLDRTAAALL